MGKDITHVVINEVSVTRGKLRPKVLEAVKWPRSMEVSGMWDVRKNPKFLR